MGFGLGDHKGPIKKDGKAVGIREGAKITREGGGKILDLCLWWTGKNKKS